MSKLRVELYKIIVNYKNNKGDFPINQKREKEETTDLLEQISDDFAVKFAKWYIDNYHLNKTTTELLKIFKEKYYVS